MRVNKRVAELCRVRLIWSVHTVRSPCRCSQLHETHKRSLPFVVRMPSSKSEAFL
jgi:hypothetical protein